MKQPLILLTAGFYRSETGLSQRRLYQNYADGVSAAGGLPVLGLAGEADANALAERCDALLLTGGEDMEPARFGEAPLAACGTPDLLRDAAELALFAAFFARKKPIFGICRGLQVLNVALGGSLWQDLASQCALESPLGTVHPVQTAEGSLLAEWFGPELLVNSYHHQAVREVASGLKIAACAENGALIEALEHESLPILGVQWHPERMLGSERITPQGPDMLPFFTHLIALCR